MHALQPGTATGKFHSFLDAAGLQFPLQGLNVLSPPLTCMQDEFYLREWPSLAGRRFADVLLMFEHAMPVGVRPLVTGEVLLNPADDYVLAPGRYCQLLAGPELRLPHPLEGHQSKHITALPA